MKTLVNVLGMGRSGTTMLDLMIGNASNAFSCGEVYAWFRPWRTHHRDLRCGCGADPCPVWERIKGVPESSFHETVFRELGVDVVADSSKDFRWVMDVYGWLPPEIRIANVLIWKEPIDLACSWWKRGVRSERGFDDFAARFRQEHARWLGAGIPLVTVRYGELVASPAEKLRRVCELTGVAYFEGKERFWSKTHHHLFGSSDVRDQVRAGESRIRAREPRDEAFEAIRPGIEARLDNDARLERVVLALEQREVDRVTQVDFTRPKHIRRSADSFLQSVIRRLWGDRQPLQRVKQIDHK